MKAVVPGEWRTGVDGRGGNFGGNWKHPISSFEQLLNKGIISGKIFDCTFKTHTFQVGIYFNSK